MYFASRVCAGFDVLFMPDDRETFKLNYGRINI